MSDSATRALEVKRMDLFRLAAGHFITKYWLWLLIGWVIVAAALRTVAPAWDDIAADGDLRFLPSDTRVATGRRALENAFPGYQFESQLVIIAAGDGKTAMAGEAVAQALDLARHLHWYVAQSAWQELDQVENASDSKAGGEESRKLSRQENFLAEIAFDNVDAVIGIDDELARFLGTSHPDFPFARIDGTYKLRSQILTLQGAESDNIEAETIEADIETAQILEEQSSAGLTQLLELPLPKWSEPVQDVWTWRDPLLGHKLLHSEELARVITLQLSTDFTSTRNVELLQRITELTEQLRDKYAPIVDTPLRIELAGSAAVGSDLIQAAAGGVRITEVVTIALVCLILIVLYQSPLLILIPMLSIALSLSISTSLIALLAQRPESSIGFLQVFTTTRIFIVVLLFGAGTDFCLFFLARNRELILAKKKLNRKQVQRSVASAWLSVHRALIASAVTTMVGLGLMWFSDFAKFQYSGPIIAIALGVTLCVCLTFTPALCVAFGRGVYWPAKLQQAGSTTPERRSVWTRIARFVTSRPKLALLSSAGCLAIPATWGFINVQHVTYDLPSELSAEAPSRRGQELAAQFFPVENANRPVTIIAELPAAIESEEALREACTALAEKLYIEGVLAVRHISDPLGDYPPGRRKGMFDRDAWRQRILKSHRLTLQRYVSSTPGFQQRVARFDVVLDASSFSVQADEIVGRIEDVLSEESERPESKWHNMTTTLTGTAVGIGDLRRVTQADQNRIRLLVTIGVWLVLLVMLRKPLLTAYLIATVLLSYLATLGITHAWFAFMMGEAYVGLDWKVPLFLFVILVAVGQDYNVYLVTRIIEETKHASSIPDAVSRALSATGGIITSCGLVMAGTFIAMTSPAILSSLSEVLPEQFGFASSLVLSGITELGFALACGVMLDTLIVRSILVPAFVVWRRKV